MASGQRADSTGSWNRIASILGGDKCKYAEDKDNTRLHSQEELIETDHYGGSVTARTINYIPLIFLFHIDSNTITALVPENLRSWLCLK